MSGCTIETLASSFYSDVPDKNLYHYTSLAGLMGVISSKSIWASEIRYLNDDAELNYLNRIIQRRITFFHQKDCEEDQIARQFAQWLSQRVDISPLVFVVSFTEAGSLLSQWRGYTPHGQGVNIGFRPQSLLDPVAAAGFTFGKCIYDHQRHEEIALEIVEAVIAGAAKRGPAEFNKTAPTQTYYPYFAEIEPQVLRICALIKHPCFVEENEWRAVSKPMANYVEPNIKYRVGKSYLIPYIDLPLAQGLESIPLAECVIGPTPTPTLLFNSVSMYMRKYNPQSGGFTIYNSNIPFRG